MELLQYVLSNPVDCLIWAFIGCILVAFAGLIIGGFIPNPSNEISEQTRVKMLIWAAQHHPEPGKRNQARRSLEEIYEQMKS